MEFTEISLESNISDMQIKKAPYTIYQKIPRVWIRLRIIHAALNSLLVTVTIFYITTTVIYTIHCDLWPRCFYKRCARLDSVLSALRYTVIFQITLTNQKEIPKSALTLRSPYDLIRINLAGLTRLKLKNWNSSLLNMYTV